MLPHDPESSAPAYPIEKAPETLWSGQPEFRAVKPLKEEPFDLEKASLPNRYPVVACALIAASMPVWLGCQGLHKNDQVAAAPSETPAVLIAKPVEHSLVSQVSEVAVVSESREVPESDVDSLVQSALGSHPKIQAARARVSAALHRIPQARALDDPMMNNQFWPIRDNALQTAGGRMEYQIDVSQRLPWPQKRDAKAAIACREAQMAQQELATIELEIAEAVRTAYVDLWLSSQSIDVVRQNIEYLQEALIASEARYRTGGSQQDVISTEIQLERLSNRLSELEAEQLASHAILVSFLKYAGIETVHPTRALQRVPADQDLEHWIATAHAMNPDLQRWALQIQRDLQKQRLANLQRYPDLQVGTQYGFMTAEDALSPVADGLDNLSFTVGLTLPIWKSKIDSGVREARADRTASSQSLQAEQLTVAGNIEAILASIDALEQQRLRFSESILPRAEQAVEIGLSEYRVGKTTFVQMITNYRDRLEVQLEIIRLEAALAKRFAQLQRIAGSM